MRLPCQVNQVRSGRDLSREVKSSQSNARHVIGAGQERQVQMSQVNKGDSTSLTLIASDTTYELPDGTSLHLGSELNLVGECLFDPSLCGKEDYSIDWTLKASADKNFKDKKVPLEYPTC